MQIQEQQHGAVTVVKPLGALAGEDAETFKSRTEAVLGRSMGRVVIDASGYWSCNSAAALFTAAAAC